jgi:hypothetical protein
MASVINVVARPREHPGRADNTGEVVFYLVEFDTTGFTLWDARNATEYTPPGGVETPGVPADGTPLTAGSNIVVTQKVATPKQESPRVVLVEVTYSVPTSNFTIFPPDEETTKWNISIEAEGVSYTESVHKTASTATSANKGIRNSRDRAFNPPLVKEYFDELVAVTYTTNAASLSDWDDEIPPARGKINSDVVELTVDGLTRTFPAETLKLGHARYGVTIGFSFAGELEKQYRVYLPLMYRADTWTRRVVDQDVDPTGEIVYLDGSGGELAAGADAVLLDFEIEETTAFLDFLYDIG